MCAGLALFCFLAYLGITYFRGKQQEWMDDDDELDPLLAHNEYAAIMNQGQHAGAHFTFKDVTYTLHGQTILNRVSGQARPGELLAIMGSSGAGKTSLLDILAHKSKRGEVHGSMLLNGVAPARKDLVRMTGYVDQEDTLMSTLTVRETLMYSAMLRLPKTMSVAAKKRRVDETMTELGIRGIADRRIGGPGHRGISGGEKRRVSIAQELVTSPSIVSFSHVVVQGC